MTLEYIHTRQHRAEAAVMLTHFEHAPGMLDFLHFLDELD